MYLYGLGSTLPPMVTPADYTDCGGGLSVAKGTPCPLPAPPIDPALLAQGQAAYDARRARCVVYENKEKAIDLGVGLAAAWLLPGWWKLLALPIVIVFDTNFIPRIDDCDYGM